MSARHLSQRYCEAVDRLREERFSPELHFFRVGGEPVVMLRWTRRGARWHAVAAVDRPLPRVYDRLGCCALGWLRARAGGTGDERRFAVMEP